MFATQDAVVDYRGQYAGQTIAPSYTKTSSADEPIEIFPGGEPRRYNARNQLTTEICANDEKDYSYDLNGNNVQIDEYVDGILTKTTVMGYDCLGRMTGWTDGTNTETYANRGVVPVRSAKTSGAATTTYLNDGLQTIGEYENGVLARQYGPVKN